MNLRLVKHALHLRAIPYKTPPTTSGRTGGHRSTAPYRVSGSLRVYRLTRQDHATYPRRGAEWRRPLRDRESMGKQGDTTLYHGSDWLTGGIMRPRRPKASSRSNNSRASALPPSPCSPGSLASHARSRGHRRTSGDSGSDGCSVLRAGRPRRRTGRCRATRARLHARWSLASDQRSLRRIVGRPRVGEGAADCNRRNGAELRVAEDVGRQRDAVVDVTPRDVSTKAPMSTSQRGGSGIRPARGSRRSPRSRPPDTRCGAGRQRLRSGASADGSPK